MKKTFPLFLAATVLVAIAFAQDAPKSYPWKAAAAKAVITPKESVWMAGYAARKSGSEGVLQDIHAKALAIEDAEGGRMVFVTLDLIGVPKPLRVAVEKIAKEKHGLEPAALLMNASHTHCGPMIRLYNPPGGGGEERAPYMNVPDEEQELRVRQVREYNAMLVETIDGLIGETLANLEPATLTWSKARCGFSMNRRTPTGTGGFRNSPNPDGPVDQEVPVLQVHGGEGGKELRSVLFGYACHATTLSISEINGDWPGYAQTYFEEDHPETVALFLNGASGDQNPYPRRMLHYVERHGRSMATAIEAALQADSRPVSGPMKSAIAWPEIPYAPAPSREDLEERAQLKDRYESRYAQFLLDVLGETGSLPKAYPVPVQVVRFGDSLTMAAIGGEVTVDYSHRLKRELAEKSSGAPIWFAGYSNDVMSYVPSKRVIEEGGYEGKTSFRYARSTVHPNTWDTSIEERLVGTVHELFDGLGD